MEVESRQIRKLFAYSDNSTTTPGENRCVLPLAHGLPIVCINYLLVFVGTFGNFLIILAVLNTPKLRNKISNFLLLSLAVADLFVTMCAQPLHATSVAFTTFGHFCVEEIDYAYDIAGNFSCFCSLFHLASISVDRALVVSKPHQHHSIMKKFGLRTMLGVCWGTAILFVCLRVPFPSTLMLSIALIVFNYMIIIISYAQILNQIRKEKVNSKDPAAVLSPASRDARMEKRVAGTIAIIIIFFSLCWFPLLGFYSTVKNAVLRDLGGVTYMWIRTLVLSNSSMNFIVYSCRIDHFRIAYLRIINRAFHNPRRRFNRRRRCNPCNDVSGMSGDENDSCFNVSKEVKRTPSLRSIKTLRRSKELESVVDQGFFNEFPLELVPPQELHFDTSPKHLSDKNV